MSQSFTKDDQQIATLDIVSPPLCWPYTERWWITNSVRNTMSPNAFIIISGGTKCPRAARTMYTLWYYTLYRVGTFHMLTVRLVLSRRLQWRPGYCSDDKNLQTNVSILEQLFSFLCSVGFRSLDIELNSLIAVFKRLISTFLAAHRHLFIEMVIWYNSISLTGYGCAHLTQSTRIKFQILTLQSYALHHKSLVIIKKIRWAIRIKNNLNKVFS